MLEGTTHTIDIIDYGGQECFAFYFHDIGLPSPNNYHITNVKLSIGFDKDITVAKTYLYTENGNYGHWLKNIGGSQTFEEPDISPVVIDSLQNNADVLTLLIEKDGLDGLEEIEGVIDGSLEISFNLQRNQSKPIPISFIHISHL